MMMMMKVAAILYIRRIQLVNSCIIPMVVSRLLLVKLANVLVHVALVATVFWHVVVEC